MANYTKDQLRKIFQCKYDRAAFTAIIRDIMGSHNIRTSNEKFTTPEDKETGYYIGYIDTPDAYHIGLFYYEINSGSVAHKKVGLRNLVKRFVNQNWGEFDAAIVVFNDGKDWRLSFIYDIKEEATTPKRFTFVFGEKDNFYRTAIDRFEILQNQKPTFENIRKAFSVEALSDDFFDTYRSIYADFVQYITGKRYVKERNKWVERELSAPNFQFITTFDGDGKLVRDYIKKMFGRIVFLYFLQRKGWLDGNRQYMHDLFYNSEKKDDFLDGVLEPLFFEVLNTDKPYRTLEAKALPGSENIPYLNGGLFAKDDIDPKTCVFPADYFRRLFDFLDSYNFTIDENDTDDAEIGIDPEMLGRIFENLLEDNKDKGAFYTPKEIVDYMCRESLIAYLLNDNAIVNEQEVRNLVENNDGEKLSLEQRKFIKDKLKAVKICDPAIGSGAFPMGLVNILSKIYQSLRLSTDIAFIKRHIMEQNIYGVDIEKGAVDIARLRFWLAMIVEEKDPIPLPNLHFKIMQGNSLLESYNGIDLSDLTKVNGQLSLFDSDNSERESLISSLKSYYNTSDHQERALLFENIIKNVRRQLYSKGIILTKGEDPSANTDFFLWHTWFTDVFENGGFDIVIGNPPYVSSATQVANPILANQRNILIENKKYTSLYQKWDLYIVFVELGLQLLTKDGIESMIVPYPITNQEYARKLREIILGNHSILEISDLKDIKVFKNATVQNCILFIQKESPSNLLRVTSAKEDENKIISIEKRLVKPQNKLTQNSKGVWNLTHDSLSDNRHSNLNKLGDFCYISKGMVLHSESGSFKKDDLISNTYSERCTKKYIEAKDIFPYGIRRTRWLEWGTSRCPTKISRPTFEELYLSSKLLINCLGELQVSIDENENYYCEQSIRVGVLWKDIKNVHNKSISSSIKRYSKLSRIQMESLSEKVNLKYLTGILNSKYGQVLLKDMRGGDYHIVPEHLRNIPIPIPSYEIKEKMNKLVDSVLKGSKKPEKDILPILKEIDILVYKAYGISYEEISSTDPGTTITREDYEKFMLE